MQYYINLTYQFRECTEVGFMGHHHILSTKGRKHISPVTNLTLCGTILLGKPVVTHLVRKFPQFCGNLTIEWLRFSLSVTDYWNFHGGGGGVYDYERDITESKI